MNKDEYIKFLESACRDIYEVWAGSEGIPMPETAPEGYLLFLVEQMRDIAKRALAQHEQEPNHWRFAAQRLGENLSTVGPDGYYNMSASEWLDWATKHITPARIEQDDGYCQACEGNYCTAKDGCVARDNPPQREWVGLTDDEIDDIWAKFNDGYSIIEETLWGYERAIEAKIREKNA